MARTVSAYLAGAVGDDVAYTSEQFGHEDARFTLNVYTHAVKQRQRLSQAELVEFNRATEWAQMGLSDDGRCRARTSDLLLVRRDSSRLGVSLQAV